MVVYSFRDTFEKFSIGNYSKIFIYNYDKTLLEKFHFFYFNCRFSKIKPKHLFEKIVYIFIIVDKNKKINNALFANIDNGDNINSCISIGTYKNESFTSQYTFIAPFFKLYLNNMKFDSEIDISYIQKLFIPFQEIVNSQKLLLNL